MQAVVSTMIGLLVTVLLAWSPAAEAGSPGTQRALRNVQIALDNITLVDAYATAIVPEKERRTATNLLRDIDYALQRANGDLGRIPPEDQDADVKALQKRVADLTVYRDKLAKNLEASVKGGAELDARYRAYREDIKPFAKALRVFTLRPGSAQQYDAINAAVLTETLAELAKVEELCTGKYKGLEFNDRLAFQLAVDPKRDCAIAEHRQEIATTLVEGSAANDVASWVKQIDESRTKLAANDGFVSISGNAMHEMLYDPGATTAALMARHQPNFKVIGKTTPADLVVPITTAVAALWTEIDRLAPTYTFPAKMAHDKAAEAGAAKAVTRVFKGNVVKSGMLLGEWSIAKNGLDIPTEQYRTGAVLFKAKESRWCQYREFTAHKTYMGGGKYQQAMSFTFAGVRYQKCK